jgi:hypothetical protein
MMHILVWDNFVVIYKLDFVPYSFIYFWIRPDIYEKGFSQVEKQIEEIKWTFRLFRL